MVKCKLFGKKILAALVLTTLMPALSGCLPSKVEVGFPYVTQLSPATRLQGAAASPSEGLLALLLEEGTAAFLHTIDMDSGALLTDEVGKSIFKAIRFNKVLFKSDAGVKLITQSGSYSFSDLPTWVTDGSRPLFDVELLANGYALLGLSNGSQRQVTAIIDGRQAWVHTVQKSEGGWIFESHGGKETLQKVFDNYIAVYGPGHAGLTVLDAKTGTVAWEYHLPKEDYVISVSESASGLWVSGTTDSHESILAFIDQDGKVKRQIAMPGIAGRIAAFGPVTENKCWFMCGLVGEGGPNQVYLWEGQADPVMVLEEVSFRPTLFPESERDQAIFFSDFHDQYFILSADGDTRSEDMPISSIERNTADLLYVAPDRILVATRELKPVGDTLHIRSISLEDK